MRRVARSGSNIVGTAAVLSGRWRARRLSSRAGAIGSPKLLMLSGIGPADELRRHGIAVAADLPGVGLNLQDHLDCYTVYDCNGPHSYYGVDQYVRQALWTLQYLLFKNGPLTTNIVEAGAFVTVDKDSQSPDIQLHFLPAYVVDHGMMRIPGYGVCLYSNLLATAQPRHGHAQERRSGRRAADRPQLSCRSLRPAHGDRGAEARAQRSWRRRRSSRSSKGAHAGRTRRRPTKNSPPMSGNGRRPTTIRSEPARWARTLTRLSSPQLAVHGVEALRVVNSSVMPLEISANTNAPTIMIAEKGADIILAAAERAGGSPSATGG